MIANDYTLTELNQQSRTQVADSIAALHAGNDHCRPRISVFRRRTRTAPITQPVTTAVAYGTGSTVC